MYKYIIVSIEENKRNDVQKKTNKIVKKYWNRNFFLSHNNSMTPALLLSLIAQIVCISYIVCNVKSMLIYLPNSRLFSNPVFLYLFKEFINSLYIAHHLVVK